MIFKKGAPAVKIKKIRLQNIKSYVDETISFFDGVNFISGSNGAGKSTIIESTGYALFDCRPGNLKEFVRYGSTTGVITVHIEANDQREYLVVRKIRIPSGGSWQVYDLETNSELDLHGAADVKVWLRENLGLEPDHDPAQLFHDVIGITQGTFVSPFLERPEKRKQIFNAMLKVEEYREAFEGSRETVRYLEYTLKNKENELRLYRQQVEGYHLEKARMAELETTIQKLTGELDRYEREITTRELEKDRLKEIKDKRDKLEGQLIKLAALIQGRREKEATLSENLAGALQAKEKVNSAEPGYREYLRLTRVLDELETKRQERDSLKQLHHNLENEAGKLQAEITTARKNVSNQQQEIAFEKSECQKKLDQINEEGRLARQAVAEITALQEKANGLKRYGRELSEGVNFFKEIWRAATEKYRRITGDLTAEADILTERLIEWDQVEKKVASVQGVDKNLEMARDRLAGLKEKINTLGKNRRQSTGGKCPFLHSPCRNVGGDLEAYFTKEIELAQSQAATLEEEIKRLKAIQASGREAEKKLISLKKDRQRLEQIQNEQVKLGQEISLLFIEALEFGMEKKVEHVRQATEEMFQLFQKATGKTRSVEFNEQLIDFQSKCSKAEHQLNILAAERGSLPSIDLSRLPSLLDRLDTALASLEATIEAAEELREKLDATLTEETRERSNRLEAARTAYRAEQERLNKLDEKSARLEQEKSKLKDKERRLQEILTSKEELARKMATLKDLDKELKAAREQREAYQGNYEEYMKYQKEAAKAARLELEHKAVKDEIRLKEEEEKALAAEFQQYNQEFDKERYQQLETGIDRMKQERGQKEVILQERHQDYEECQQKIAEMDAVWEKISKLEERIRNMKAGLELLEFIRVILKQAGEPIAAVYRQHLSRKANHLYREVARENVNLEWREDYEVTLVDSHQGRERVRAFRQLSGGEQMTAALAVRLALLSHLSKVKVGFFDEPTSNLDGDRRANLAQTIPEITGDFEQLFIISHDDTFDSMTDNVIQLTRDHGDGSKLMR